MSRVERNLDTLCHRSASRLIWLCVLVNLAKQRLFSYFLHYYTMSCIRVHALRRIAAIQTIRVAPTVVRSLHTQYRLSASQSRQFSSSPKREATPHDGQAFLSALRSTPLYKEISEKPEVLQAAKQLVEVMQAEGMLQRISLRHSCPKAVHVGFGMDPNNPPSPMKLLLNSKVRQQMMLTVSIFKENGIDAGKLQVNILVPWLMLQSLIFCLFVIGDHESSTADQENWRELTTTSFFSLLYWHSIVTTLY